MDKLSVDHLIGIKSLKKADIDLIFRTAIHFKEVIPSANEIFINSVENN